MKSKINNTGKTNPILKMALVLLCTFSLPALAQTDTLQYSEETAQDSMVQYLTPLEYAFMMHEETPWMVKINLVLINAFEVLNSSVIYEQNIAKGFSLSGGVGLRAINRDNGVVTKLQLYGLLESRWYYNMVEKVKSGKAKLNLSGNYLAFGTGYTYEFKGPDRYLDSNTVFKTTDASIFSFYAKWGVQRRFLKRGYVDFGLKSGFDFYLNDERSPTFLISTFINAGLVFAKDKQKPGLDRDKLCSVLRCYAADRFLVKTNLISLLSVGIANNELSFSFNPEIAAELKLGASPFSLNADVRFKSLYGSFLFFGNDSYFTLLTALEGRWYYNLKKRILKGKTGNGLSANYVALGNSYRFSHEVFNKDFLEIYNINRNRRSNEYGFYLVTGIQRTYAKHFYIDVSIGLGFYKYLNTPNSEFASDYAGQFAIGYRF